MTLTELAAAIPGARLHGPRDGAAGAVVARGVAHRADQVRHGDLFVCVRGQRADGHDFAGEALARGAAALVVDRELPVAVPQIVVPDTRRALGPLAAALAGDPSQQLTVVGITGTNGKTTCSYLTRAVLEAAGMPCGLVGTVEVIEGGRSSPAEHTTPDAVALQGLLARMRAAGDRACAMEVSSHALDQGRVAGMRFAAALFTNLTRDHLDYHPDVEAYYLAKRSLFVRPAGEGDDPPGAVNLDDPHGRRLAQETHALGFALERAADVRPEVLTLDRRGVRARLATPRGPIEIESPLRGRFNASNVAGVVAVAELLELPHGDVARGIASVAGVPGRLEPVDQGQPFQVLVDYAHTPDSLQNVLTAVRELAPEGRVLVVFGCGGDRDRGKRPQMGAIARRLADVAVVTSDNPRSEDPEAIIAQIVGGAGDGPADLVVEPDRRRAIALALDRAAPGDVVVIAGKGHERGQEAAGVVAPFDDREVARELVAAR